MPQPQPHDITVTDAPYIELDCTITHDGKSYTANGAYLDENACIGYLHTDGILTNWHGCPIGTYRIAATWKTPRSYVSATMSQVYATVNGITYTGRSAGIGMLFRGRRVSNR